MSVSENGIRQLLREYFEDYTHDDKFLYTFGVGQFLVTECKENVYARGVSKNAIIELLNEYFNDFSIKDSFIFDMQNNHFLVGLQTAVFKEIPEGQKRMIRKDFFDTRRKTKDIFEHLDSITDDEPSDIHYCESKDKHCVHADPANNKEIGFTVCSGEYCDKLPEKCKKGFGENEVLG